MLYEEKFDNEGVHEQHTRKRSRSVNCMGRQQIANANYKPLMCPIVGQLAHCFRASKFFGIAKFARDFFTGRALAGIPRYAPSMCLNASFCNFKKLRADLNNVPKGLRSSETQQGRAI